MIFADNLLSLELQYGAFALCGLLIVVLFWVLRFVLKLLSRERDQNAKLGDRNEEQNKIIENDLKHIHELLDSLPCQRGGACPEEK